MSVNKNRRCITIRSFIMTDGFLVSLPPVIRISNNKNELLQGGRIRAEIQLFGFHMLRFFLLARRINIHLLYTRTVRPVRFTQCEHFVSTVTVGDIGKPTREHYNPEGCGFDSRWCHWNFSLA